MRKRKRKWRRRRRRKRRRIRSRRRRKKRRRIRGRRRWRRRRISHTEFKLSNSWVRLFKNQNFLTPRRTMDISQKPKHQ
jgi:hypothetical protein